MFELMPDDPKKTLLYLLKTEGEITVDQAQETLDLAKTTIRQHLSNLEERGLVERHYKTIGQGRPIVLFSLTALGNNIFPNRESALLQELLKYMQQTEEHHLIDQFFEHFWNSRKIKFQQALKSISHSKNPSYEIRLKALQSLLQDEGFMPTLGIKHSEIIRECNCPFRSCISITQLPCRLEAEFISEALGVEIKRTAYIPKGEMACIYSLSTKGKKNNDC